MGRGMTIADFVQQVFYAQYKVRLDVDASIEDAFHSKSDKFKEVVMEANFVLQEFQKEQDWNFLRKRWTIGLALNIHHQPCEYDLPHDAYKLCCGYGDSVRMYNGTYHPIHIPFTSPRQINSDVVDMFNEFGDINTLSHKQMACVIGDQLVFKRMWHNGEVGHMLDTDYIRLIGSLHICDDRCDDNCKLAYEEKVFRWMPDPYYFVIRTAARRAVGDPSTADMAQELKDEAAKILSAIRENDSEHNVTDTYTTSRLNFIEVM